MANTDRSLETRRTMTGETRYRALFLGAGPQMHCGVGQFTRLLQETIEKLEPGTSATLTLTRSEGTLAEIWRAVGSTQSVVCNFPIVAWKRVMFAPLVQRELADDPLLGWTAKKSVLAPLPPNIEAPAGIEDSKLRHRLIAAKG